jgi:hypothetical protein
LRKTDSTVKLRTISHIKNFIFPQHLVGSLVSSPYLKVSKLKDMTQFQQSMLATEEGSQRVPTVIFEGKEIPYAGYQLAVHIYALKIMALGMKMRGVTFTQIKKFYGLRGRTAKECLPQLQQMQEMYRTNSQNN